MNMKKMKYIQYTSEPASYHYTKLYDMYQVDTTTALSPPVQQVKTSQQTPKEYLVGTGLGS